ncbi:hypothetical protein Pelo_514 [Pelomyxa schiedti]|nr:hypothetical protein Pelo_514 [Pelomyxa schiedti]
MTTSGSTAGVAEPPPSVRPKWGPPSIASQVMLLSSLVRKVITFTQGIKQMFWRRKRGTTVSTPTTSSIIQPQQTTSIADRPTTTTRRRLRDVAVQKSVAFLAGWHHRAGGASVMSALNVPPSVATLIIEWIMAEFTIHVYTRGTWQTIGGGITIEDDTVVWRDLDEGIKCKCASTVGGRIAWLEPSIQQIAGNSNMVYWAFDLVKPITQSCQEGLGASSSLMGMVLDAEKSHGGDFYPITYPHLSECRGVKSFGLSFGWSILTRVQGTQVIAPSGVSLNVTADQAQAMPGDRFSFLVTFQTRAEGTSNKERACVGVWRNHTPLVRYCDVDTSVPMFPTVHMCCCPTAYKFVMNPPLPPGI